MNTKRLYNLWIALHDESAKSPDGFVGYRGFYSCECVDTYIGMDGVGNEYLFIALSDEAAQAFETPSLSGITFSLVENQHIDNKHKLLRVGMAPGMNLNEAFEAFTVTLVCRISLLKDDMEVIEEIYDLSKDYANFFKNDGKADLTPIEEQGLFGELLTLSEAVDQFGDAAVDTWVGQDKNRHDFVFKHDNSIEVKTSLKQNRRVFVVSNDVQLSFTPGSKLFLKFMILEKNPSGRTIAEVINDIYENKISSQASKEAFDRKLLEGKVKRGEITSTTRFLSIENHYYEVGDEFPRFTLESIKHVSPRIYDVKYKVDLDGLEEFRGDLYECLAA